METTATFSRRVTKACQTVRDKLLAARCDEGYWVGELSSSALATATAISALSQYRDHSKSPEIDPGRIREMIEKGCRWLAARQNDDGGWGDTDQSHSNVATSMLGVAALTLAGAAADRKDSQAIEYDFQSTIERANRYIRSAGGIDALRKRYGKDKTFAVPILANCAIAGRVPWSEVAPLPFEAAIIPQKLYRFVSLPVVSYAIPALVAIGQLRFFNDRPNNPVTRWIRKFSVSRSMKVLTRMQPASGGFLEAIPLTCFVGMSLANTGRADHQVMQQCIRFIDESFRDLGEEGGTWPIDTNLETWNTTLAINALDSSDPSHLTPPLLDWLMACQYRDTHPFTGAAPGGWGWSDLSGAVPDADDTPGALLALRKWYDSDQVDDDRKQEILLAAGAGVQWLLNLQNRDKGWPTFCKGWGRLPFDRSGNDITAHVIRGLVAWQPDINNPRIGKAIDSGFKFVRRHRIVGGGWLPLWFGNQDHRQEDNPLYGTVKVLAAYRDANRLDEPEARQGIQWLIENQNEDFGWGGGPSNGSPNETDVKKSKKTSSVQETSLAIELLASLLKTSNRADEAGRAVMAAQDDIRNACQQGTNWLLNAIEQGKYVEKWPIGFYFAKLWYYESLYPLVFSVAAMQRANRVFGVAANRGDETSSNKLAVS